MNSSSRGESSLNVDSSALIACSGAATAAVEQVFFFSKADTDSDVFPGKRQGCQRFALTVSIEDGHTCKHSGWEFFWKGVETMVWPSNPFQTKIHPLCVSSESDNHGLYSFIKGTNVVMTNHTYSYLWSRVERHWFISQTRPRHFYQPRVLTENTQAISSSCKLWRCLRIKGSTLLLDTHWSFRAAKPAD